MFDSLPSYTLIITYDHNFLFSLASLQEWLQYQRLWCFLEISQSRKVLVYMSTDQLCLILLKLALDYKVILYMQSSFLFQKLLWSGERRGMFIYYDYLACKGTLVIATQNSGKRV